MHVISDLKIVRIGMSQNLVYRVIVSGNVYGRVRVDKIGLLFLKNSESIVE